MNTHTYEFLHAEGTSTPIKGWVRGVPLEEQAHAQLRNIAAVPFVGPWVAVMPDVHLGKGATVGSVIPTRGAIIPAAVGVDIGCGMAAVRTTLRANDLPDNLAQLRSSIERSVPVGNGRGGEHRNLPDSIATRIAQSGLVPRLEAIKQTHRRIRTDKLECQIGTLGGGNHFIEICLDETDAVWVMLHSGSRGTGNLIGTYFIERARQQLAHRVLGFHLPDKDLAFFMQGEPLFDEYVEAVSWAQDYARENREAMMARVLAEMRHRLPKFQLEKLAVNCHHNYVQKETHGGEELLITRKGAVSARTGELGIIPGSMGTRSYIVRGLGNAESFHSCSHGAGRLMSRTAARQQITLAQHREATAHVECRKDAAVIDESPAAYKSIEAVMAAQQDLVEVLHTLRQVVHQGVSEGRASGPFSLRARTRRTHPSLQVHSSVMSWPHSHPRTHVSLLRRHRDATFADLLYQDAPLKQPGGDMTSYDKQERKAEAQDLNRDPISGTPGSHPVGVGVGGIAGGAAAGALAGTVFGPLGTLIGAAAGVVAGAAAGKGVAERLDPTVEAEYWRQEHRNRPYYKEGTDYDRDYATVYGFGLQARETRPTSTWEETEATLAGEWPRNRGESRLEWDEARLAARDAWDRADRTHTVYRDNDNHYQSRFDSVGYREADYSYDDYRPAYRYGMQARQQHAGRQWDDHLERDLGDGWDRFKADSRLSWEKAKHAVREAFDSDRHDGSVRRTDDTRL